MKPPLQLAADAGASLYFRVFCRIYLLGAMSSEGYPKFAAPGSMVPNPMPVESFRSTRCGAKRHQ